MPCSDPKWKYAMILSTAVPRTLDRWAIREFDDMSLGDIEQMQQQAFLAGEIEEYRSLGHGGRVGNLLQRGRMIALHDDKLKRCL